MFAHSKFAGRLPSLKHLKVEATLLGAMLALSGTAMASIMPTVSFNRTFYYTSGANKYSTTAMGLGADAAGNVYELQSSVTETANSYNVRIIKTTPLGVSSGW